MHSRELLAVVARCAHELLGLINEERGGVEELADGLVRVAAALLPELGVVVSLRTAPTHYVQAGAPPWLRELGRLQTRLGEGPTAQAMQALAPVEYDPQGATRRGQLNRALARAGYCGLLAVPIRVEGAAAGAFTFAHPDQGAFEQRDRLIGEVIAEQAALAVGSRRRITQLRDAVASRDRIGQAKGLLMAKHQVDASAAFAMLVRASQETNIKLADVASWYIEDSADRPNGSDRPPPNTAT